MSFWKSLFGGGSSEPKSSEPAILGEENYKGYLIKAITMSAGSEYQLAGTIEKSFDGETKTYQFVRADRFSSKDDVANYALAKGRLIIDEQGDGIFR